MKQSEYEQEIKARSEINPRTGNPFQRGDTVKTSWGLVAKFWGYNRIDGVILIQTQPDSNTWQHSVKVGCLVA